MFILLLNIFFKVKKLGSLRESPVQHTPNLDCKNAKFCFVFFFYISGNVCMNASLDSCCFCVCKLNY